MNRSPFIGLLLVALVALPVAVSQAAHHEGPPPGDHMPPWTIEEAVQQAQTLPAALQPTYLATVEGNARHGRRSRIDATNGHSAARVDRWNA